MLEDNCLEKNFKGFRGGSNSTAPMPAKVESSDDRKDASVGINQIAFEAGRAQLTRSSELQKFHMQLQSQQLSVIKLGRMTAVSMLRHNS